jgi:hypothetical protein
VRSHNYDVHSVGTIHFRLDGLHDVFLHEWKEQIVCGPFTADGGRNGIAMKPLLQPELRRIRVSSWTAAASAPIASDACRWP